MPAVVIVDRHEPHHEVAARLLELAAEQGLDVCAVVAQRGEHDAALSFQVPPSVQEAFDLERGDRWPVPDEVMTAAKDPSEPPVRKSRPGKAGSNA